LPSISKCAATAVSSQKRSRKNLIINWRLRKWTQSVQQMIADGATLFTEVGQESIGWIDWKNQ
jgi:[acyl-carrier-protein] S-malonyltransferase